MKKLLFTLLLVTFGIGTASAQFEKGKKYIGATTNSAGLSYSKDTKLSLGLGINAGYMFEEAWMAIAEAGFNYTHKDMQQFYIGAKCRYLIEQNGLFLQAGLKYVHEAPSFNDLQITPEIGYVFFLNHNLTVEPSLYYDISTYDFDHHSKAGVKIGLAWYF